MLKGIIFDMDGLMVDTEKLLTRFWGEAAAFYGFNMTKEHVLGIRSLAAKYAEPRLKGIFGDDFDYQKVRRKRIELMNAYIEANGIEKKKGLDELLDYLASTDLKLAVATATDLQRTKMYLSSINIFDRFDKVICGNMITNGKPAPDIYLTAAKALELAPRECIALEDSPNGIRSAYDAGAMPVMVPDLSQPDEDTKKLLFACCDDLSQVIDVIKNLM
ncbi:HAD family phosphatase [Ruminococcus sp.]|uniref:HAD family hydrolase n=1 Tax=Ruminococcus sp. TaxID=41978 RepID=UPI0025D37E29|nr:HAD family phosphatase [Ruminococcus sp.]